MTQTLVRYNLTTPARSIRAGSVTVALCIPAFAGDNVELTGVATVRVERDGSADLLLDPNSELTPPGTWYVVTKPDGTSRPIVVPVSTTPVDFQDCVTDVGQVPGLGDAVRALSSPPDHNVVQVYVDTSTVPPVLKGWNGTAWVPIGGPAAVLVITDGGDFVTVQIDGTGALITDHGTYVTFDTGTSTSTITDHGTYATLTG